VVFVPFFAIGGAKIAGASRKYYSAQQAALGAANGYVEETVTGQKVVKVFNHETVCCEEFETLNEDLRDKQLKAQFIGGLMGHGDIEVGACHRRFGLYDISVSNSVWQKRSL
jgi:ATP-binding cassette subfamily B protein